MKACQIYKLEILKFMYIYKKYNSPQLFSKNYFTTPSETHNYPTWFACDDNWATVFQHKSPQRKRSIQYNGHKIWNDLQLEIKRLRKKSYFTFLKRVKNIYVGKRMTIVVFLFKKPP